MIDIFIASCILKMDSILVSNNKHTCWCVSMCMGLISYRNINLIVINMLSILKYTLELIFITSSIFLCSLNMIRKLLNRTSLGASIYTTNKNKSNTKWLSVIQ